MICRLCLINVNVENKVSLFNGYDVDDETHIVKMIAKYFYLEVTQHDSISTTICQDCCHHLNEFHKFCNYVEEKQNTLRKEFLEVKCDVLENLDEPNAIKAANVEAVCDIKDVLEEPIEVQVKCEEENGEETNIFEDFCIADRGCFSEEELSLLKLSANSSNTKERKKRVFKKKTIEKLKIITRSKKAKETIADSSIDNEDITLDDVAGGADNSAVNSATGGDYNSRKKTERPPPIKRSVGVVKIIKRVRESLSDSNTDKDDVDRDDDASWGSNATANSGEDSNAETTFKKKRVEKWKIITRSRKARGNLSDSNPDDNSGVDQDDAASVASNGAATGASKELGEEKQSHDEQFVRQTTLEMDSFIIQHMELKCDLCDTRLGKYSEVRTHYRKQHNRNEYIRCCGSRFNKRRDLYDHINWHLDPEYFKCNVCGKLMKNRSCLNQHKVAKHQKKEDLIFKCDQCQKRFARLSRLTSHIKTTHEANRRFACKQCDKKFAVKHALVKHIQSMHDNIFPHICDVCGMKFKFKPSFITHLLEHQGIVAPPVKCPECGEWVKNQNRLRLHMTTHNKVDVHCKYCGRVCASLSAMRAHIQYMHRRPPSYKCTFCDKYFKTPKIVKEHIATHTGENLYSCPHCVKEFRSSANMYVHIKRQHTQEWLATKLARRREPPQTENDIVS